MDEIQTESLAVSDQKIKTIVIGTALGALLGAGLAFLMARQIEENEAEVDVSPGTVIAIALAVLGLMRQLSQLARPAEED